ncbi:TPA: hypothetical protein EYP38_00060 [Candidatus Micrarchaeota archaeon]|nr:hypothetical protein [Candidatus Micrarchaeota archaeon]
MKKILFVPNTLAQVQKFSYVIRELPEGTEYRMIVIDRFKSDSTLPEIRAREMPYTELESMEPEEISGQLREEKADLIVLGNDVELVSRAVIDAARSIGVPTLLLQDGIICPYNFVLPITPDYIPTALSIYGPMYLLTRTLPNLLKGKTRKRDEVYRYGITADNVAVWGDYSKREFVELGAKAENVFVTGSPAMDLTVSAEGGSREEILRKAGADPEKKTLLFVPADMVGGRLYSRKEYRQMCDTICSSVKRQKDIQMIIKPHPSFIRREPKYFDRYLCDNIFLSNDNPYHLLRACDALVAEISTMILEAIAFGLPIVVANLTGRKFPCEPYPRIYVQEGVAILLEDEDKADGQLRSMLFDEGLISAMKGKQAAFIEDQLSSLDGRSAKRIVALMQRIIDGKEEKA